MAGEASAGEGAGAARRTYVYELGHEARAALCRTLDVHEAWRELAGAHMAYSVFDIEEMSNEASRLRCSPSKVLLERWGQLNHSTNELFVLLYQLQHVPAMLCLKDSVEPKYLRLLSHRPRLDGNSNNREQSGSVASIPLPVRQMGNGDGQGVKRQAISNSVRSTTSTSNNLSSLSSDSMVMNEELRIAVTSIPMIPYRELTDATDNWHPDNMLGKGGFGDVFKGEWKQTRVAIKRLKQEANMNQEFLRELCLNGYRHDNLLPLYGYSIKGPGPCLVYQLMMGGSLEQRLRCKNGVPPLTWKQRHNIALGTARGLQFLHNRDAPLIHGDIKPANILLDPCSEPKIGDFGLARKGPFGEDRMHVKVSKVQGTRFYLPEDYIKHALLSTAVDVFSFGMVIFEMASACRVYDKQRGDGAWLKDHVEQLFNIRTDLAELEDPLLKNSAHSEPELCRQFMKIGLLCTKTRAADRPTMLNVYQTLSP